MATYVVQYERFDQWIDGEHHCTKEDAEEDQMEGESYMPPSRIVCRVSTIADTEV